MPSQPVANPRNHPPGFQPQMGLLPQPMQIAQPPQPPQNTPPLPKGPHMKNVKAITILRSGKILEDPYKTQESTENSSKEVEEIEENSIPNKLQENDKGKAKVEDNPTMYKPKAPFPTALEVEKERKRQYI